MGAKIWFNGVDLNKFGPTPFINLSKAVNRDGANVHILSETINITLEGKITAYKKGISEQAHKPGIDRLLEDEKMLRDLFSRDGILEVTCSNHNFTQQPTHGAGKFGFWWDDNVASSRGTIGKGLACKVTSYQISKTDDNWVNSIDYTIELQCNHSKSATLGHAVANTISGFTDEWTIEPVEDSSYYNLSVINNSPQGVPGPPDWPTGMNKLDNLIQYRISHRVGAQGLSAPTGFYAAGVAPGSAVPYHGESAWYNAKRFVEEQLKMPHNNINHVFLAYNNTGFGQSSYVNEDKRNGQKTQNEEIYLYNHVRAVNVSESNGTYDVTDTWLALSKPTHYLEDYSVEVTQDTNFNVTARINGTVTGLEIKRDGYIEGSPMLQSMQNNTYNGTHTVGLDRGKIDLQNMNEAAIYSTKYGNALEAWRNYVEPLLYVRTNVLALYMVQGATTTLSTGGTAARSTQAEFAASNWDGKSPQMTDIGTFQVRYPQNNFGTCDYLDKRENIILDTRFVSKTIGSDPARGTITYSCEFNNRRGANQIKGATILSLNVQDSKPADVVAEMFVMGRKRGPILQDTGSKTAKTRQVSIEIQTVIPRNMAEFDMRYNACPMWTGGIVYRDLMNILDMLRPVLPDTWTPVKLSELKAKDSSIALINGSYAGQVYIKSDDETWNPIEGRFSKNITWVYDA